MILHTNVDYLTDTIDYFKNENKYLPYIFVSEETMKKNYKFKYDYEYNITDEISEYHNCRVFKDNKLGFNEVILR